MARRSSGETFIEWRNRRTLKFIKTFVIVIAVVVFLTAIKVFLNPHFVAGHDNFEIIEPSFFGFGDLDSDVTIIECSDDVHTRQMLGGGYWVMFPYDENGDQYGACLYSEPGTRLAWGAP